MTPTDRLTAWTALSFLALVFTLWLVWDNCRNYQAVMAAVRQGRLRVWGPHWWIAASELVASVAMVDVWLAIATVGVLGFLPGYAEYRSWGQLLTVVLLTLTQTWRMVARQRAQRPVLGPAPHQELAP